MPRPGVVVASEREGRIGAPIAGWFVGRARQHAGFDLELVDLKAIDLPMLSEPNHPRLQKYTLASSRRRSATVAASAAAMLDELLRWTDALWTLRRQ